MRWSRTLPPAAAIHATAAPALDPNELTLNVIDGSYVASGTSYAGMSAYIAGDPATFARAAAASYDDTTFASFSSGAIRTGSRGILIEPSRTNIILRSQELDNAYWTVNSGSRSANAQVAPDGTTTAETITGTTFYDGIYNADMTIATATTYTYSIYWKPISGTTAGCISVTETCFNTGNGERLLKFTASGTTLENFTEATAHGVRSVGNGWYRVWVTFTTTAAASGADGFVGIYMGDGSGSRTNAYWGAQFEAGTLSSYIPTTTATVTRPADDLVLSLPTGTTMLYVTLESGVVTTLTGLSAGNYSFPTNLAERYIKAISNKTPVIPAVAAKSASSIVDKVGINVHYPWNGTDYATYKTVVTARIIEGGFKKVRVRWDTLASDQGDQVAVLLAAGVKLCIVTEQGNTYSAVKTALDSYTVGSIVAVEGFNEPTDASAASSFQTSLFDGLRADSDFNDVAILAPSVVSETVANTIGGTISAKMDAINIHPYAYGERPEPEDSGYSSYGWHTGIQDQFKSGAPVWITEAGYHNYIPETTMPGVSEAASAVYGPRSIAWFLTHPTWDIRAYYRYEALNNLAQPAGMEQHFGIMSNTGAVPKPEFWATRALLRTINDTGGAAGTAKVALSGANPGVVCRPITRSDGRTDLLIWRAADVWSTSSKTDLSPSDVTETITLGENWTWAQVKKVGDGRNALFKPLAITAKQITLPIGPGVSIIRLGTGTAPVSLIGTAVAANALSVGVHTDTASGDFGLFFASHNANSASDSTGAGLSGFLQNRGTNPARTNASGGKALTANSDTQTFGKASGTFLRLLSATFRGASGVVGTPGQDTATAATSISVPSMTVNDPGSAIVIALRVYATDGGAALPLTFGGDLSNAFLITSTTNTNYTVHYIMLQDVAAFAGGTISWTGSADYQYARYVIR